MSRYQENILNNSQVDKLGNLCVFFSEHTYELTKTKLLKLVYLCEEYFVKKFATPFLGMDFKAWQFGPVLPELYVNLDFRLFISEERNSILSKYISYHTQGTREYIQANLTFDDSEFTDDEIDLISLVAKEYYYSEAKELVFITHKDTSLWYRTVMKEDGLLAKFEKQLQPTSDLVLDFSELLVDDSAIQFYKSQIEFHHFNNSLKA